MHYSWIDSSRLWLVLDRKAAAPRSLAAITKLSVAGGTDVVLCRIKDASIDEVLPQAHSVRLVCRELGVPFVMSHYPEIAVELAADGVQLGVGDLSIELVRDLVGPAMAIGFSTHGFKEAKLRFKQGADYVFLGPIFKTPEKLKYGDPLGLGVVEEAQSLPRPVVFIGGISQRTLPQLIAAGGRRIAAIGALQRSVEPTVSARVLKHMLFSG